MFVEARMVHYAVGDKIWETSENVLVPLNTVPGLVALNPAGGLVNIAVLSGITDEQWQQIMDSPATAAGNAVLERIRLDAVK
jgi:hypothetical protein